MMGDLGGTCVEEAAEFVFQKRFQLVFLGKQFVEAAIESIVIDTIIRNAEQIGQCGALVKMLGDVKLTRRIQ